MERKPAGNYLLKLLEPTTQNILKPHLEKLALKHGTVLHRGGEIIDFVYFPITCILSVLATTQEGQTAETSVVGRDGVIGASVAHGIMTSFANIVVQISGESWRIPASDFSAACQKSETLCNVIALFDMSLLAQSQQSTACQAIHPVESRAARWLMQCSKKLGTTDINLTQEFFAQMLGVQRTTVNLTEKTLKKAGLISIGRGQIRIDDPEGLKAVACECLDRIEKRYVELLGDYSA